MENRSVVGEQVQLSLDIPEPRHKAEDRKESVSRLLGDEGIPAADNSISGLHETTGRHSNWLASTGAVAASILLYLAVMPETPEPTSATIADNFVGMELAPVNPIERHLPEFKLSEETAILQVGLFRHLKGAESSQRHLTALGLSPEIIKRVTVDGVMYALVIHSHSQAEHQVVLDKLQANDLTYFHQRRQG